MSASELPKTWDEQICGLGGNILQSAGWAAFQQALCRKIRFDQGENWAWLGIERAGRGVRYLDVPWGPVGNWQAALESVRHAGEESSVDFVRFEPEEGSGSDLKAAGAKQVSAVQPQYPWVLDLDASEDEMRSGMTSGHRSAINGAARRGVKIRKGSYLKDMQAFLNFMHKTAGRGQFTAHPDEYYKLMMQTLEPLGLASLYLAESTEGPVAAAIVFDFNGVRYYAHAGADQGKNRKLQASAPLVWQMILDAKKLGFQTFHFWGVTPSTDPNHPWAGFSKFKRAFGGRMLERLGTWELPLKPAKYQLYRLAKRVMA